MALIRFVEEAKEIPQAGWVLIGMVATGALAIALAVGRRISERIRHDGDPGNDWIADLIDALEEAHDKGDHDEVGKLIKTIRAQQLINETHNKSGA